MSERELSVGGFFGDFFLDYSKHADRCVELMGIRSHVRLMMNGVTSICFEFMHGMIETYLARVPVKWIMRNSSP